LPGGRDRHIDAGVGEVSSCNESTATAATRACGDRDSRGRSQIEHEPTEVATGVLHHLQQLDPEIFNHRPIDLDHVGLGDPGDVSGIDDRVHDHSHM